MTPVPEQRIALGPWPLALGPWPLALGPWPLALGPWPVLQRGKKWREPRQPWWHAFPESLRLRWSPDTRARTLAEPAPSDMLIGHWKRTTHERGRTRHRSR
ncbi:hypothetical protein D1122_01290 [Cereibacter sphaeroides]|nr:hypothetical protein D1122_01290 [Cereibacter sphaeroides]